MCAFLAVTGYASEEYKERALKAGFDGHLVKPVNPEVLVKQLTDVKLS